MKKKLKIGIIGAGPSGSMSAILLSKAGHDVTLFEKHEVIPRKVCGEYLCPQGVDLLERHQLRDQVCDWTVPLKLES